MFPHNSAPLQTHTSSGSHAEWGARRWETGVTGEIPQLQSLPKTSRGGEEQTCLVEDLPELRGKSWSRAWWEIKGESYCRRVVLWQPLNSFNELTPVPGAERVDIGLPYCRPQRINEVRQRRQVIKENKKNVELERATRLRTCKLTHFHHRGKMLRSQENKHVFIFYFLYAPLVKIPLDKVQETWEKSSGPFHIMKLADHYGVFRDLFPMAYFLPQVSLHISYSQDSSGQVYYGNRLTPTEVCQRNGHVLI